MPIKALSTRIALSVAIAAILNQSPAFAAAPMPATFNLSLLDGQNGFAINGADESDALGASVSSAGDINNDGIDDFIIGANARDFSDRPLGNLNEITAKAAIIFGSSSSIGSSSLDISSLDGSNGFLFLEDAPTTGLGISVSAAGDINNDGIDDLIMGAHTADPDGRSNAGQIYVLFGADDIGAGGNITPGNLDGSNGFTINGIKAGDNAGVTVSGVGDISGDSVDDVLIGASAATADNGIRTGQVYALLGSTGLGATGTIELSNLTANDGFVMNGISARASIGRSIGTAGDINADGIRDFIIGAPLAGPNNARTSGQSYVVFGNDTSVAGGILDLSSLNGVNGFSIDGIDGQDQSGVSVSSAGDFNGDGIDDLLIGASGAAKNNNIVNRSSGESYVVFGAPDIGNSGQLDLTILNGSNGFIIEGIAGNDGLGRSVSSAGDVNGDGSADIILGARGADPEGRSNAGQSYVVFGGSNAGGTGNLNVADLNGRNGVALNGTISDDFSGTAVSSAGDVNDDGVTDLLVGASRANRNPNDGDRSAGESYVVFMPLPDDSDSGIEPFNLNLGETRFLSFHPKDRLDSFGLSLSSESIVLIETANDGTALDYDTSLIITSVATGFEEVVASNDDIEPGINEYSRIMQTLAAGEYFVSVTSLQAGRGPVTIPSYALSVTVLEPCDVSDPALQKTLGNGQFELLSLPCQPPEGTTINDLFNDDIEGEYFDGNSGTWVVFTWDPEIFAYVNPGPNGTLEPGQGFWISQLQANGQDVILDLPQGSVTTHSTGVAASACASDTGCLSIALSDIEFPINPNTNAPVLTLPNLIGNPYDQVVTPFDEIRVTTTRGVCSIAGGGCSPTKATLPSQGGADVLGNVAFTFNPQLNDGLGDYEQIISGSVLEPWQGFWVFQLPAGIDNNPVVRFPDLR